MVEPKVLASGEAPEERNVNHNSTFRSSGALKTLIGLVSNNILPLRGGAMAIKIRDVSCFLFQTLSIYFKKSRLLLMNAVRLLPRSMPWSSRASL